MSRLAIIGAGAMGLAAAHHAAKRGHQVTVFDTDTVPGGMAAHLDLGGLSIERYYHFVCKTDQPTFDLLAELGIADRMKWRDTSMGYFIDGQHYRWGDPVGLLTLPLLDLVSKFRYGLQMFRTSKAKSLDHLETVPAHDWIIKGAGQRAYDLLWRRLLELKFFEYADDVSASWIATRVRRIGRSRRSILQEELGYIEGGTQTLIDALVASITANGGRLRLGEPVTEVLVTDGRVHGVRTSAGVEEADAVICTVPTPYIPTLVPALSDREKEMYRAIKNIGVVCVLLKLKRQVTGNFWLNINDPRMAIPGIIEFSNLRPVDDTIVYVPYYMPHSHPKWAWNDDQFIAEAMACLSGINSAIGAGDLISWSVGRLPYAQPVCEPGFKDKIPPVQTSIAGLQIADTSFYYPEDRGIAESVRYGEMMAQALQP